MYKSSLTKRLRMFERRTTIRGPRISESKVHQKIAKAVEGEGNPDFRAEQSAIKSKQEARYGEPGTVRIDAYENHREISTVCVYDPKTGKRGLSFPRMTELAKSAFSLFAHVPQHFIVIEVRPGQGQP